MTENEAIKNFQQELKEPLSPFSITMCNMAIQALEKVQAFEAIGTIEEFKALKEKSLAKKPIAYKNTNGADCPCCGARVRGIKEPWGNWCSKCGQKLDWSE